jgi:signal transduction histidine kinase
LLDYEQRSRLRIEQTARFRHALLGPVQGLLNQADELDIAISDGNIDKDELRSIAGRTRKEANRVALWREFQRLYATDRVRVVRRMRPLRPIVQRCFERFREPIRVDHNRVLQLDFGVPGQLDLPIDEDAIDLVLNNLLDNARKYSFANTTVTINVAIDNLRQMVRVIVEDIGWGIPHRDRERIYDVGERMGWDDPIRPIVGTGLGLPISRRIVREHDGDLFHESKSISTSDVNRCAVRFIMELPRGWRR